MIYPGIAVVADAAYAPKPFTARSTKKAAEDADALGRHLLEASAAGAPLQLALEAFNRERLRPTRGAVRITRGIDEAVGLPRWVKAIETYPAISL